MSILYFFIQFFHKMIALNPKTKTRVFLGSPYSSLIDTDIFITYTISTITARWSGWRRVLLKFDTPPPSDGTEPEHVLVRIIWNVWYLEVWFCGFGLELKVWKFFWSYLFCKVRKSFFKANKPEFVKFKLRKYRSSKCTKTEVRKGVRTITTFLITYNIPYDIVLMIMT